MKIRTEKVIDVQEWDKLVQETYKRPYRFQQQDGCQSRGSFRFTVPDEEACDFEAESIPEIVNHETMGVSFAAWLKRDPKQRLSDPKEDCGDKQWSIDLWWSRNFYPEFGTVANDLHKRGLLAAGDYTINIDW